MTRLNRTELKQLSDFASQLREKEDSAHKAITEFVAVRNDTNWGIVCDSIVSLNSTLDDARNFVESLASTLEDYIDRKSDKWRDGERGVAFQNWLNEFDIDLDEFDIEYVESEVHPDNHEPMHIVFAYADALNSISSEPMF